MSNPIFIVFACDAWKATDSMRLVSATTSRAKLKELVATCVESETFEYGEDSVEAAATQLRKDFDSGLSAQECIECEPIQQAAAGTYQSPKSYKEFCNLQ